VRVPVREQVPEADDEGEQPVEIGVDGRNRRRDAEQLDELPASQQETETDENVVDARDRRDDAKGGRSYWRTRSPR
jgi:hypothetical protein